MNRFYVIARGRSDEGDFTEKKRKSFNEVNPIVRDTVTVNPNSYIVIRFAGEYFETIYYASSWHVN